MEQNTQWQCVHCYEIHDDVMELCWKCGADKSGSHMVSGEEFVKDLPQEEVHQAFQEKLEKLALKEKRMFIGLFSFIGSLAVIGFAMHIDSFLLSIFGAILCAMSAAVVLLMKLTMNAYNSCPQCDNSLSMMGKGGAVLSLNLPKLTYCHHCGVSLVPSTDSDN